MRADRRTLAGSGGELRFEHGVLEVFTAKYPSGLVRQIDMLVWSSEERTRVKI